MYDKGLAVLEELLAKFDRTLINCSLEFSIKERSTYHVIDGFPRLVAAMLVAGKPLGLSGVSYTLDLDHAEPFRVDWNQALIGFYGGIPNACALVRTRGGAGQSAGRRHGHHAGTNRSSGRSG